MQAGRELVASALCRSSEACLLGHLSAWRMFRYCRHLIRMPSCRRTEEIRQNTIDEDLRALFHFPFIYRTCSLVWPGVMRIYCNKWKFIHNEKVQLPEDFLGHQYGRCFIVLGLQYGRPDGLCSVLSNVLKSVCQLQRNVSETKL